MKSFHIVIIIFRWSSGRSFIKKCKDDGSIDIVNCIVDENTFVAIGDEVKKGDTV